MKSILYRLLLVVFYTSFFTQIIAQVPSYVPTTGLLAWYPLAGNANNAFGAGNNGIPYGAVAYGTDRFGYPGTCYVGNGASGIDLPGNNFPTGNAPRTFSAWYKSVLPYPGSYSEIIATGSNAFIGSRFGSDLEATSVGFESVGFGKRVSITYDSCWHNLTITYPPGGTGEASVNVYFDGALATTYYISSMPALNSDTGNIHAIGALFLPPYNPYTPGAFLYSFTGSLDDIGVWNRELTAAEVSALYYAVVPITTTSSGYMCVGATIPLADTALYGTWTSSDVAVATVGSGTGVVTGVSAGTAIISYTTGIVCPVSATMTVTVYATPPSITGSSGVCAGSTMTLADGIPGGTWSSSNTAIATIGSSTGVVTGVTVGSVTITYALPGGCTTTTTVSVTNPVMGITGYMSVCAGANISLNDATSGGTWSSGNTLVATVGSSSGIVAGVAAGTAVITYTVGACSTTATVTVNAAPATIGGLMSICAGSTGTLTNSVTGGTWTSGNASVANIGSASGVVTGISAGTAVITYTLPGNCYTTTTVTVNLNPSPITGVMSLCAGSRTVLSDNVAGGVWTTTATSIVSLSASCVVNGIAAGTAVISYSIGNCIVSATITVNPSPGPIIGPPGICVGGSFTFTDSVSTGTWMESDTSVAVLNASSGMATGVTGGVTTITYTLPSGCFTTAVVTVNAPPGAISGITTICSGLTTLLTDVVPGGTWTSNNNFIAAAGSTSGIVAGVSAGIATISYSINFCSSVDTIALTILPIPAINLGRDTFICPGDNAIIIGDHYNTPAPGTMWKWNTDATSPTISVVEPGTYFVTVSLDGCTGTDSVHVANDCYLDLPNVFTPNGDGLNDYFFPRTLLTKGLTSFGMQIYNRWGQNVFNTSSLDGRGWDGRLNNVPQPEGVYVYIIDAVFRDGQKQHHQGNVTLLR